MTVKANLRMVLLANDVTVAETDDTTLWQHTLATITGAGAHRARLLRHQLQSPQTHFASG